jgi:predicted nuclease of predicted toxin-antitoxin system
MRILLDENIPVDFAAELPGHEVNTVVRLGWAGVLNGELMRRAAECCDVFVTLDRNIEFQQNISALPFGVIVVRAISNRMVHLRPLASAILLAISAAKPGKLQKLGA